MFVIQLGAVITRSNDALVQLWTVYFCGILATYSRRDRNGLAYQFSMACPGGRDPAINSTARHPSILVDRAIPHISCTGRHRSARPSG